VAEPHSPFGSDAFGRWAEKSARFFGTPQYILGQSIVVVVWIALNSIAVVSHWDPYPFILLNLAFSTQAAYAAPLILLAETRQAERDKLQTDAAERKHDEMQRADQNQIELIKRATSKLERLLESNTTLTREDKELTEQVADLTRQIHAVLTRGSS
jgi:uncharacterized membrane protein